jgi:serine/threonine protein kinase
MGEVYRARDTRLNRPVAIKFLSAGFADESARRRFQQEAQMASALNHPHIVSVHDVGEFEGRQYLVSEFIDGGTLRQWIQETKPGWRQTVELLIGVADALACAHDAGILHRDIKPENILVTRSGYAKLSDFGLAKLAPQSSGDELNSAVTAGHTQPGMIVGTIAYMSPEQASGNSIDARSDIFSFGVLLYESVAGRKPFKGASDLETLQMIIHGRPSPLGTDIPERFAGVIEKALEKDPADRYQSVRDLVVDLRRLTRTESPVLDSKKRRSAFQKALIPAGLLAFLGIAGLVWLRTGGTATRNGLEYTQITNFADSVTSPAISPDGRMLTFIRGEETFIGKGEIYVKLLPDGDPVQLTHDGLQKMSPSFSPDNTKIAYTAVAATKDPKANRPPWDTWIVPVLGGEPRRILSNAAALTWTPADAGRKRVLFSEWEQGIHMTVVGSAENRSEARTVYAPASINGMAHRAYLSPDQKSLLIAEMDGGWTCRLAAFDRRSPSTLIGPIPSQCTTAAWSPDGKWMYFSANTGNGYHIWRQRFPNGTPEQITFGASEEQGIALAPDGRTFLTSVGARQSTLWVHDARGGERQITSEGFAYLPAFSTDDKHLYYLLESKPNQRFVSGELWVADLETGGHERLLSDFLIEHYSVSSDGKRIVFVAVDNSGHFPVWVAALDGSSPPVKVSSIDGVRAFFGVRNDVFFMGADKEGPNKFLYHVNDDGSGLQKALPDPIGYLYDVSPDAKQMPVISSDEVRVYPIDGGPPTVVCTACAGAGGENRGITPPIVSWSRDGRFLFLHGNDSNQTWTVRLRPGQTLPPLPSGGVNRPEDFAALPEAHLIPQPFAFAGSNPDVYAYARVSTHRNIYRVSIP